MVHELDIAKAWGGGGLIDGNIHVAGGNDNQGGNYRSEVLRLDAERINGYRSALYPSQKPTLDMLKSKV